MIQKCPKTFKSGKPGVEMSKSCCILISRVEIYYVPVKSHWWKSTCTCSCSSTFRDAPFDIWGGGGPGIKLKKKVCCHERQKKKFAENVGRKKKFVVEIDEKYVDQKKHQMLTYIIGEAYDNKFLRRNIKKNCRTLIATKKTCFPPEVKKKVCKQQKL